MRRQAPLGVLRIHSAVTAANCCCLETFLCGGGGVGTGSGCVWGVYKVSVAWVCAGRLSCCMYGPVD
jgi:hypothetical protein